MSIKQSTVLHIMVAAGVLEKIPNEAIGTCQLFSLIVSNKDNFPLKGI